MVPTQCICLSCTRPFLYIETAFVSPLNIGEKGLVYSEVQTAIGCESPQRLGGSDSQVIESSPVNTKSQRDGDELRSRTVGSAGV